MRLRQPYFFSTAREATKSIGPDRYTRAPCNNPDLLLEGAIAGRMLRGAASSHKRQVKEGADDSGYRDGRGGLTTARAGRSLALKGGFGMNAKLLSRLIGVLASVLTLVSVVAAGQQGKATALVFDPANFVDTVDNKFFP